MVKMIMIIKVMIIRMMIIVVIMIRLMTIMAKMMMVQQVEYFTCPPSIFGKLDNSSPENVFTRWITGLTGLMQVF